MPDRWRCPLKADRDPAPGVLDQIHGRLTRSGPRIHGRTQDRICRAARPSLLAQSPTGPSFPMPPQWRAADRRSGRPGSERSGPVTPSDFNFQDFNFSTDGPLPSTRLSRHSLRRRRTRTWQPWTRKWSGSHPPPQLLLSNHMSSTRLPIAVVDDDQGMRTTLRRLLCMANFDAETFPSGADFLDSLQTRQPDCVVLDMDMPPARRPGCSGTAHPASGCRSSSSPAAIPPQPTPARWSPAHPPTSPSR